MKQDASGRSSQGSAKPGLTEKRAIGIGAKIYALVFFCLALLCAVAATSAYQMHKIGVEIEAIAERDLPTTAGLTQVTIHQLTQAINFERAVRYGEEMVSHPEIRKHFEESIQKFRSLTTKVDAEFVEVSEIAKHSRDTAVTDEARQEFQHVVETLAKLAVLHKDYDHLAEKVFEMLAVGDVDQALTIVPKIVAEEEQLDHGLEDLLLEMEKFTGKAALEAEHHEKTALSLTLTLSGAALLVGIIASILLVVISISRPLRSIVRGLDALNSDDLSVDVKVVSNDEIGKVAKAYGVFKENMVRTKKLEADQEEQKRVTDEERNKAIEEREKTSLQLEHAVDQVSSALSRLAEGDLTVNIGADVAAEFEKTKQDFNNASEQLHETLGSVARSAREISSSSGEIAQASGDMSNRTESQAATLEQTAAAVEQIVETVRSTSASAAKATEIVSSAKHKASQGSDVVKAAIDAMKGIEESSKKMADVIGVIDEIAFQTNLLALNAGVEAARAGEAGRGFAVVASEVRALAQRSADESRQIKDLISSSSQRVDEGVNLVQKTGTALEEIVGEVSEVNRMVSEISAGAKDQAASLEEVNIAVGQLDEVTQQNAAMAEEATAATRLLSDESSQLEKLVGRFVTRKDAGKGELRNELKEVAPHAFAGAVSSKPSAPAAKQQPKLRAVAGGGAAAAADSWEEF